MKIERIVLCYSDMDRIIVNKEDQLSKYDLSKVIGYDVEVSLAPEEFVKLRAINNILVETGTSANIVCEARFPAVANEQP